MSIHIGGGDTSPLTAYIPLIVGLGAVILGVAGNVGLEWIKQGLSKRHARQLVRACLMTELRTELEEIRGSIDQLNALQPSDKGIVFGFSQSWDFYDLHKSQLGLLNPEEASLVLQAYYRLRMFADFSTTQWKVTKRAHTMQITAPAADAAIILSIHQALERRLAKAVAALQKSSPIAHYSRKIA